RPAERLLRELTGWAIDAETLRRLTHAVAADATRTRGDRKALPAAFAAAHGPTAERPGPAGDEVDIDAGPVNTTGGWRDVTVAVFAVRGRADPCASADAASRELPAPVVRSVIAAVEEAGVFAGRCRAEADRLGRTDPSRRTVPGDGAEWIGNRADEPFPTAGQVLDYDHAAEYLAAAGRESLDAAGFPAWWDGATGRLLADGYAGACEALAGLPAGGSEVGVALNDLAGHRDRLNYAARWRRGPSIGSGLVEGTIQQRVNLRLKRTGARWRVEGVGPLVELRAMSDTPEWSEYWTGLAA
ncbi:MAG: hypothetical protein ACRC7O_04330, partial [Fimbriiglobus sp.]